MDVIPPNGPAGTGQRALGTTPMPARELFEDDPGEYIARLSAASWPAGREAFEQIRRDAGIYFLPQTAGSSDAFPNPSQPQRLYASCFAPEDGIASWSLFAEPGEDRRLRLIQVTDPAQPLVHSGIICEQSGRIYVNCAQLPTNPHVIWAVRSESTEPDIERADHGDVFLVRGTAAGMTPRGGTMELEDWHLAAQGRIYAAWQRLAQLHLSDVERMQRLYFLYCAMCVQVEAMCGILEAPTSSYLVPLKPLLRRLKAIPNQGISEIQLALIDAFRPIV